MGLPWEYQKSLFLLHQIYFILQEIKYTFNIQKKLISFENFIHKAINYPSQC